MKLYDRIKDWMWFHVCIEGNEFHDRLNIDHKKVLRGKTTLDREIDRVARERERAHQLDMKYKE